MIHISNVLKREEFILLTRKNNLIASYHLVIRVSLLLLSLALADYCWDKGAFVLFVMFAYIYGVMLSFCGFAGLAHELSHATVFTSKIANRYCYFVACALLVENSEYFMVSHPYHHKSTFSSDDHEAKGSDRWRLGDLLRYALLDYNSFMRKYFYACINSVGREGKRYSTIQKKFKRAAQRILIINILLHVIFWLMFNNITINVIFLFGPFIGSLYARYLARAQHLGLEKYVDEGPLHHSRTLLLPKFLAFLYANMNFHIEHHLAPSVPYYNLPKLHQHLLTKGLIANENNLTYFTRVFIPFIWMKKT